MSKTFDSKLDFAILAVKFSPLLLFLSFVFFSKSFVSALPLLVPFIFSLSQLARAKYELAGNRIIVRYGFSSVTIDINDIGAIVPKDQLSFWDWFHSYGNSQDSLLLTIGENKSIIISPKQKQMFLFEIEREKQTPLTIKL